VETSGQNQNIFPEHNENHQAVKTREERGEILSLTVHLSLSGIGFAAGLAVIGRKKRQKADITRNSRSLPTMQRKAQRTNSLERHEKLSRRTHDGSK